MAAAIDPGQKCMIKLSRALDSGTKIRIHGLIPPDAQRFSINFLCGLITERRKEVAFHLNPRFTEMVVVRNHLTANMWGQEERIGGMPVSRNDTFEAIIECDENTFKVYFNGRQFCEFEHRLPYKSITHVEVNDDVNVFGISVERIS